MNKKGLTLTETIAVLVVLSIVAIIIIPNIAKSLRKSKNKLTQIQLNTISEAAKNWSMDHLNKMREGNEALKISVGELQDKGYLDNVVDPKAKDNATIDAFAIIKQTKLQNGNYRYEYGAYTTMDDYYKSGAIKYAQDGKDITRPISTTSDLKNNYIYDLHDSTTGNTITIEEKLITVRKNNKGEYIATIESNS